MSRHKPTVTKSCRRSTAMRHQQHAENTVEGRNRPKPAASTRKRTTTRISSRRLDEMWHGSCSTATCVPVAPVSTRWRQRSARRSDQQTARGQGARNRGTGRDEHPEREGGGNSRCEATRAAQAGFAIERDGQDSGRERDSLRPETSYVHSQATRGRQNHIETTTLREGKNMSHETRTW